MNVIYKYIITGFITAISLFLMWYFSDVLFYILISAVLSLMGKPLVDLLSKVRLWGRNIPVWVSATITLLVMWSISIVTLWHLVPIVLGKLSVISTLDISDLIDSFMANMNNIDAYLSDRFAINVNEFGNLSESLTQKITDYITPTLIGLRSLVDKTISFAIGAFSVSFITFFFLKESELFKETVKALFPQKYESNAERSIDSSITLLSRYFIGLLIESSIKLIVITLALKLFTGLDLSDSVIIALISAVLNVIPYIGPIIGAIIGVIIAITSPELAASEVLSFEIAKMLIIFGVFQLIDNIIIQPYVYSSSVKAHPLEIFIVILLAGSMAGITGMLLAIPAYTVIRVFAKEFFNKFKVVQKLTQQI